VERRVSSQAEADALEIADLYSWGSRTSRMNKSSPREPGLEFARVISALAQWAGVLRRTRRIEVVDQLGDGRMRAAHRAFGSCAA